MDSALFCKFNDFTQQFHWFCSANSLILVSNFIDFTLPSRWDLCTKELLQTKVVLLIQTNWFAIASATYLHETFVSQSIIPTSSSRSTIVYKQEKSPVLFHWAHDAAYQPRPVRTIVKAVRYFCFSKTVILLYCHTWNAKMVYGNCYLLFATLRNDVIDPWQCWDWLLLPCYALIETKPVLLTDWRAIQAFVWHFIMICDEKYKKRLVCKKKYVYLHAETNNDTQILKRL